MHMYAFAKHLCTSHVLMGLYPVQRHSVLDAWRADGSLVALKRIRPSQFPIAKLFSSEPFASDPRNHCVPIYDVLEVPDEDDSALMVMPLLYRNECLPFGTIGEVVEFFRQVFEVNDIPFPSHWRILIRQFSGLAVYASERHCSSV